MTSPLHVLAATYGLTPIMVKEAKTRWQKALETGEIGAKELGVIAGGAHIPKSGRGWVSNIRNNLSSFASDLSPKQLERHRTLQDRLTPALSKFYDVTAANYPGMGPATVPGASKDFSRVVGKVHVSPQAGTQIRNLTEGSSAAKLMAGASLVSGKPVPNRLYDLIRRPEDAGITNSIIKHELGEKRMMDALSGGHPAIPFASHLGPAAIMSERAGVRDPRVLEVMDKLRTTSHDDAAAMRLLKQHGMTGNYTPALGGRTHRSLDAAFERMPVREGMQNRIKTQSPLTDPKTRRQLGYAQSAANWASNLTGTSDLPNNLRTMGKNLKNSIDPVLNAKFKAQARTPSEVLKFIASQSA